MTIEKEPGWVPSGRAERRRQTAEARKAARAAMRRVSPVPAPTVRPPRLALWGLARWIDRQVRPAKRVPRG